MFFKYNTIGTILEYFHKLYDKPIFNPWTLDEQSKFIESLLLGVPFGTIVLLEKDFDMLPNNLHIINGGSKLHTGIKFINNSFKLQGLKLLTEFNGLGYSDLDLTLKNKLRRANVKVILLESDVNAAYWINLTF